MKELLDELKNNMEVDRKGSLHPNTCVHAWQRARAIVQKYFYIQNRETATGGNALHVNGNLSFFDQVVQERTDAIHNTLDKKAKEYASNIDRFHNFRVAARINKVSPEQALKGMMLKHEVAVLDMIEAPEKATEEMINEKIGDNINYLILLEGLLKERLNNAQTLDRF